MSRPSEPRKLVVIDFDKVILKPEFRFQIEEDYRAQEARFNEEHTAGVSEMRMLLVG